MGEAMLHVLRSGWLRRNPQRRRASRTLHFAVQNGGRWLADLPSCARTSVRRSSSMTPQTQSRAHFRDT